MTGQAEVHEITPDEVKRVADLLWAAERNDPIFLALMPDERQRGRVGPWFCETIIGMGRQLGAVYVAGDAQGAAVWITPGNTDFPLTTIMKAGFWKIPFKVGIRGMMRFNRVTSITTDGHKKAVPGPHWYLSFIGVDPTLQRGGIGTALVRRGTAEADAAGLPCYLETATEGGRAFFTKQGFEVAFQAQMGDDTVYGMVRPPVAVG